MNSWTKTNSRTFLPVLKRQSKSRRITPELEWKVRQKKNISDSDIKFLEGLLLSQTSHPQLTKKQWNRFKRIFWYELR